MKFYKLTEEDVKHAETYVMSEEKMSFIKATADKCFDLLEITANSDTSNVNKALPPVYKVDTDRRARFLMGAFVKMYLKKDFEHEDGEPWLMTAEEYDKYAGGHVFEDMNRMKNNAAIRDICFDVLTDYSELKYRLDADIKGLLDAMNNAASRLLAYLETASSPEELRKVMEQAEESEKVLQDYIKNREGGANELPEEL